MTSVLSIISFSVSWLAFKQWYAKFLTKYWNVKRESVNVCGDFLRGIYWLIYLFIYFKVYLFRCMPFYNHRTAPEHHLQFSPFHYILPSCFKHFLKGYYIVRLLICFGSIFHTSTILLPIVFDCFFDSTRRESLPRRKSLGGICSFTRSFKYVGANLCMILNTNVHYLKSTRFCTGRKRAYDVVVKSWYCIYKVRVSSIYIL